jgi:peptidoglycan-N-acetylglucosamine deacetylase
MARMTVCLTFDFDAMSLWVQGGYRATEISRGEFGAFSMPRILSLLERHSILTTFSIPGQAGDPVHAELNAIRLDGSSASKARVKL